MKALHTSDWHIGQNFYGIDRSREHRHFLNELCRIVKQEKPDLLIISGDVYDNVAPTIAAQKLYNYMLLQLHNTSPEMKIVVTAGNHDSSSRLELNSELWEAFDVKIVGNIERNNGIVNYEKHIIDIKNNDGNTCCYVIAVPYIYHANYPAVNAETDENKKMQSFHQKLIDLTKERNINNVPIIMTGHLAVTDANTKGHETKHTHLIYENIEELGNGYDYLALGHIHYPQNVGDKENVRYSGSPFPMNFDEDYRHSVTIVEIEKNGTYPQIKTQMIESLIPLITIPESAGDINEVLDAIDNLPDTEAYVRIRLKVTDIIPMNERRMIEEKFSIIKAELCEIMPIRENSTANLSNSIALEEIRQISPLEIAMDYYHRRYGGEMEEELKNMLLESISKVEQENKEQGV